MSTVVRASSCASLLLYFQLYRLDARSQGGQFTAPTAGWGRDTGVSSILTNLCVLGSLSVGKVYSVCDSSMSVACRRPNLVSNCPSTRRRFSAKV